MATKKESWLAERRMARFPLGCRVRLKDSALMSFPRLRGKAGTVEAHARDGSPKVLFDGFKTSNAWRPDLLSKARASPPSSEMAKSPQAQREGR